MIFLTEPGCSLLISLSSRRENVFQMSKPLILFQSKWSRSSSYSHRMIPFFRPFWKSGPMDLPTVSSIQILSSSSFWGSYFCAICSGREVKGHVFHNKLDSDGSNGHLFSSCLTSHDGRAEFSDTNICACMRSGFMVNLTLSYFAIIHRR